MTDLNFKGLSEADAHVLLYVAELLEHGFQPRIINVTPELVHDAWENLASFNSAVQGSPEPDADECWALAKQADEEIENDHHWLDGVSEEMTSAVELMLEERADV